MTTEADNPAPNDAPGATAPDAAPAGAAPDPAGTSSPSAAGAAEQGQQKAPEAAKEEPPKSALEAVLREEAKRREEAEKKAAPAAPAAGQDVNAQATVPAEPAKPDGEDDSHIPDDVYKALPPIAKKRIGFLTRKSNEQRDRLKAVEPVVARDRALQGFLETNGVTAAEFQWLMEGVRLVKRDPAKAFEHLSPLFNDLRQHVGEVLPDDLRADVESGAISQARAQELARARNTLAARETVSQQDAERAQREEQSQQFATHVAEISGSLNAWESQWKGTDPDYSRLRALVNDKIMLGVQEKIRAKGGAPLTREEALAIANAARKNVKEQLAGMVAAPKAKTVVTGGAPVNAVAEPKNAMEAARRGLARAHGQA